MPEGDTVWRTARSLHRALSGRVLEVADLRVPQLATVDLVGAHVVRTRSRGKHLLTRLRHDSGDWTLHTHLRMEGSWHLLRPGQRWGRPAHQARVVLGTDAVTAVGFSLGVVELVATADEESVVGHVGPDLLGPGWGVADRDEAVRRLRAAPERSVHEALLDQTCVAGIGNMYAAELLFLRGIDPATPFSSVPDPPGPSGLVDLGHRLLVINKERATQATTGDLRRPLWVYARGGQPCRRCGTRVEVGELGPVGRERVTFWCPRCQPR